MNEFLTKLPTMYKAIAAGIALLIPFLTALGAALSDGEVTASEWTTIAVALGALIAGTRTVYQVPNKGVK